MDPKDRLPLGKGFKTSAEATEAFEVRSERELQNLIWNYLLGLGVQPFCQRMDKRTRGQLGQPDFLFAFRGMAVAFEAKIRTGALSDDQEQMIEKMQDNTNGWLVYVVRSMDEVKEVINQLRTMPI